MVDVALEPVRKRSFRNLEFLAFSIIAFVGKSALLIRMPYRDVEVNAFYTAVLLLMFYGYFRFRYKIAPPVIVIFFLATAVAVDVLGNHYHLYGSKFGPVQYDEFSHFTGSGCALVPAMWLLRATTRRFGHRLSMDLLAFLSVTITFSFCAYYEILELWDERFYGDFQRLWTPQDSANDLQYDLAGIIVAALISVVVFKIIYRRDQYAVGSRQ